MKATASKPQISKFYMIARMTAVESLQSLHGVGLMHLVVEVLMKGCRDDSADWLLEHGRGHQSIYRDRQSCLGDERLRLNLSGAVSS